MGCSSYDLLIVSCMATKMGCGVSTLRWLSESGLAKWLWETNPAKGMMHFSLISRLYRLFEYLVKSVCIKNWLKLFTKIHLVLKLICGSCGEIYKWINTGLEKILWNKLSFPIRPRDKDGLLKYSSHIAPFILMKCIKKNKNNRCTSLTTIRCCVPLMVDFVWIFWKFCPEISCSFKEQIWFRFLKNYKYYFPFTVSTVVPTHTISNNYIEGNKNLKKNSRYYTHTENPATSSTTRCPGLHQTPVQTKGYALRYRGIEKWNDVAV